MRRPLLALLAATVVLAACSAAPDPDAAAGPTTTTTGEPSSTTTSAPPEGCEPSGVAEQRGLTYHEAPGAPAGQVQLDVHQPLLPPGCPAAPVLVWVHGGGWRGGDKGNGVADKVGLVVEDLGWVLVSVNYRLSPDPIDLDDPDAVRFPTHNEDVAAAVAWVHERAPSFGGDPDRISLMGHSAGAGIVSTLGTDASYLDDVGLGGLGALRCVVSLDTEAYDVAAQADGVGAGAWPLYRNAFGDDPAAWREASPLTHVGAAEDLPAFFVVVQGNPTRVAVSERFVAELRAAGATAELLVTQELDHAGVNRAVGRPDDSILTPPLVGFLEPCGAP